MRRRPVVITLAVLLLGLGAALVVTVPWSVLPGADLRGAIGTDFTPADLAREQAFHREVRPPSYAGLFLGLAVSAVLGLTPLGGRLVRRVSPAWWPTQVVCGTLALVGLGRLGTLPLDALTERGLRRYGLSTQTWVSWLLDIGRQVLVASALTALVLMAALALVRIAPRTWWAWAAGATAGLVVAGSFAYPVLIEPVFNDFRPLPAGPQRTALLALADRDRVPVRDVLVADASRRTTSLNAYVSGFGATRRIVVYDTLLRTATPREVELVVAHELGHAESDDVLTGTLLSAGGAAAGVCVLALLVSSARVRRRCGADSVGDPRLIPLLLFVSAAGMLVLLPLTNAVSRQVEARADLHSLELTGDSQTFIATEQRLARTNLGDLRPNPLLFAVFASHPSTVQRIAMAREWGRLRR